MLVRQGLYHLNHVFFVLGIFEIGLMKYLPRLTSNCNSPDIYFPGS
jgi:hypothetical protein